MKYITYIWLLFCSFKFYAQEETPVLQDHKYYEDQFYIGISYISLINTENDIQNTGIPYNLSMGFIKDLPLNKKRNIALGIGIGYTFHNLKPNIAIINDDLDLSITDSFSDYQIKSHNIEFPLEYRWRTSSATKYRFWRIYFGVSLIYNFKTNADFETNDEIFNYTDLSFFKQYNGSIYTSVGFGTWNFNIKYYLQNIFNDDVTTADDEPLSFNPLMMGIMFYIL